jgi:hypothetical protein
MWDRIEIDLRKVRASGTAVRVDDNDLYSASLGSWGVIDLKWDVEIVISFDQHDREHHELVDLIRAKKHELVDLIRAKKHRKVYNHAWKLVGAWMAEDPTRIQEAFARVYKTGFGHGDDFRASEIRNALGVEDAL